MPETERESVIWGDKPRTKEQRRSSEYLRVMGDPEVRRIVRATQADTMRALSAPRAYPSDSWSGDHHNNIPSSRNFSVGLWATGLSLGAVMLLCGKLAVAQQVGAAYAVGGIWSATGAGFLALAGTGLWLLIPAGICAAAYFAWKAKTPARRGWSD